MDIFLHQTKMYRLHVYRKKTIYSTKNVQIFLDNLYIFYIIYTFLFSIEIIFSILSIHFCLDTKTFGVRLYPIPSHNELCYKDLHYENMPIQIY